MNTDIKFGHQSSRCRVFSKEDSHLTLLLHQPMNIDKTLEAALDMYPQQKLHVSGM